MQSLRRLSQSDIRFSSEQLSTLRAVGECRGRQDLYTRQTPEALSTLRRAAMIESAECSNRLEGITAPHGRIKSLVLRSTTPRNRSEQEIAGYRDALNLIHESAQEMEDLCSGWTQATQTAVHDPLVVLPLAILDFLCIHPFTDGNGRVGRLLTLLLLYGQGYEVGRYISLERIIEKSKETVSYTHLTLPTIYSV